MHELASATWRQIKEDLSERGMYRRLHSTDLEQIDAMIIATIEASYLEAVKALHEDSEDRLCAVDNGKLEITISKPVDGETPVRIVHIPVRSLAFAKTDGSALIKRGEEMVIREKNNQVYITRRQG